MRSETISEEHKPEFWFNTKTLKVEQGKQALALYRIGPFDSYQEALDALKTIKGRSDAWAEEDKQGEN